MLPTVSNNSGIMFFKSHKSILVQQLSCSQSEKLADEEVLLGTSLINSCLFLIRHFLDQNQLKFDVRCEFTWDSPYTWTVSRMLEPETHCHATKILYSRTNLTPQTAASADPAFISTVVKEQK